MNIGTKKRILSIMTFMSFYYLFASVDAQIQQWHIDVMHVLDSVVTFFGMIAAFLILTQYVQGSDQASKNFVKFVVGLAIYSVVEDIVGMFLP